MYFDQVLAGRRAVREYTNEAVDEKSIRHMIDCAVKAPNAINQQPWAFSVVRNTALLDKISEEAKLHMLSSKNESFHKGHLHTNLEDPVSHIFYHAPVLILISATEANHWIVEDCSLAAQNLMLSAFDLGLGSCWIGCAQGFLNSAKGKSLMQLPDHWVPIAPIIVGHTNDFPAPTTRKVPEIRWISQETARQAV